MNRHVLPPFPVRNGRYTPDSTNLSYSNCLKSIAAAIIKLIWPYFKYTEKNTGWYVQNGLKNFDKYFKCIPFPYQVSVGSDCLTESLFILLIKQIFFGSVHYLSWNIYWNLLNDSPFQTYFNHLISESKV